MFVFISSTEHEEHKTLNAHVESTKKFVLKELETGEKLNEFKNRLLRDMTNIEKQGELFNGCDVSSPVYLFSPFEQFKFPKART